ncbi:MAG: FIG01000007: hypothetical protein, partial [uncultured Pseudonocardia sp.]
DREHRPPPPLLRRADLGARPDDRRHRPGRPHALRGVRRPGPARPPRRHRRAGAGGLRGRRPGLRAAGRPRPRRPGGRLRRGDGEDPRGLVRRRAAGPCADRPLGHRARARRRVGLPQRDPRARLGPRRRHRAGPRGRPGPRGRRTGRGAAVPARRAARRARAVRAGCAAAAGRRADRAAGELVRAHPHL